MNIKVNVFKRCEIVLHSDKTYENPFMDVDIDAVFTHEDGTVITLPGFWNGENEWKVRFASEKTGVWKYTVTCSDKGNASLCDSGEIAVEYAEPATELEKHGYVVIPENGRFLTYADGTPFFWLGDTHWQMADYERLHECNYPGCNCGNQFKHLADDRIKKGFTVYQTYFDSAESDGGGNKHVHHWWTEKYTKINPQAFNETMDVMIEYLANNGITMAMGFGVHSNTLSRMNNDAKAIQSFAKYCVARYACYPIVWITGQEITVGPEMFATWRSVGALVGKYDGFKRPNGAHMYPMTAQDERAQTLDNEPWHQMWILQGGHGGYDSLKPRSFYKSYRDNEKVKPYLETECQYEDITCGAFNGYDAPRIGAWQALQSGCAGFTYGVTGVWAMGWNQTTEQGWIGYSPEPWYIGMDKPGSTEMTYMKNFYQYIGWGKLEPSFGYEFGAFELRKYVSISHIDHDVMVYYFFTPENRFLAAAETGILTGLKPNVKYQVRWYDPIHGKFIDLPDVVSPDGTMPIPQKPSARDWVLLLNDYDLGAYETETYPVLDQPFAPTDVTAEDEVKFIAASASSQNEEHPIANLIDGDPDTYWCGFAEQTSQTLVLDLGKEEELRYIEFVAKNEEPRFLQFRVYYSLDGKDWQIVNERPYFNGFTIGGDFCNAFDVAKGKARYVKVFINSLKGAPILKLSAFKAFK